MIVRSLWTKSSALRPVDAEVDDCEALEGKMYSEMEANVRRGAEEPADWDGSTAEERESERARDRGVSGGEVLDVGGRGGSDESEADILEGAGATVVGTLKEVVIRLEGTWSEVSKHRPSWVCDERQSPVKR